MINSTIVYPFKMEYVSKLNIFGLKMMVKSGLKKYFEILQAPSEIPANLSDQFSLSWLIILHWAAAILKGLVEFQNNFFLDHHF